MTREATIAAIVEMQAQLMRVSLRDHSRSMSSEGLTPAQFHLLVFLHGQDGVPTAEAAEALGLKPNIATGIVQRLVDRGSIERTSSPDDGRVRLLSLTPAGLALVNEEIAHAERIFVSHLDLLSDVQVENLRDIVATIVAASEED